MVLILTVTNLCCRLLSTERWRFPPETVVYTARKNNLTCIEFICINYIFLVVWLETACIYCCSKLSSLVRQYILSVTFLYFFYYVWVNQGSSFFPPFLSVLLIFFFRTIDLKPKCIGFRSRKSVVKINY
jgi:hypothetical protein